MSHPHPDLLARLTEATTLITRVRFEPTVTSTNAVLLAEGDAAVGTMLLADVQTEGRGRRGRSWTAPSGSSLMGSLLIRPTLAAAHRPLLPLALGTAAATTVASIAGIARDRVGLKWPNDLQLDGAKCAGLLVEAQDDLVVLGMGLNVDWRDVERPDGVDATSLSEAAGQTVDRWDLLAELVTVLDAELVAAQDDPAGVIRRYLPWSATIGQPVTAHMQPPVSGLAVGLTPDGHLRIRTDSGQIATVAAGDVEHLRSTS